MKKRKSKKLRALCRGSNLATAMSKQTAPTKATGGGGYTFADKSAAGSLAQMLKRKFPLEPDLGVIAELDFETRDIGHVLDDLMLVLKRGLDVTNCFVSVKVTGSSQRTDLIKSSFRMRGGNGRAKQVPRLIEQKTFLGSSSGHAGNDITVTSVTSTTGDASLELPLADRSWSCTTDVAVGTSPGISSPGISHSFHRERVEFAVKQALTRLRCAQLMSSMAINVVRCPYCVSEDEFRPMTAVGSGRYVCAKCGHLAMPDDTSFNCQCGKCAELRALDLRQGG